MLVSFILSRIQQYLRYRRTLRELGALSDRELDDIGVAPGEISRVAWAAAKAAA
jgi:Uncharacterized conserved small protein